MGASESRSNTSIPIMPVLPLSLTSSIVSSARRRIDSLNNGDDGADFGFRNELDRVGGATGPCSCDFQADMGDKFLVDSPSDSADTDAPIAHAAHPCLRL